MFFPTNLPTVVEYFDTGSAPRKSCSLELSKPNSDLAPRRSFSLEPFTVSFGSICTRSRSLSSTHSRSCSIGSLREGIYNISPNELATAQLVAAMKKEIEKRIQKSDNLPAQQIPNNDHENADFKDNSSAISEDNCDTISEAGYDGGCEDIGSEKEN